MSLSRGFQGFLFAVVMLLLPCLARADAGPSPSYGAAGTFPQQGDTGAVDAATGTVRGSYLFVTPTARGGVGLPLGLGYAHTAGPGDAGMGWSLGLPAIERVRGVVRTAIAPAVYSEYPFPRQTAAEDTFRFAGARLIEVCTIHGEAGCAQAPGEIFPAGLGAARYYRAQAEGAFRRFFRLDGDSLWIVQHKDGTTEEYGYARALPDAGGDPVLFDHESAPPIPVRWELSKRYDNHRASNGLPNNVALFRWQHLGARQLLYLTDVYDTSDPASPTDLSRFAHHTHLAYEAPDYYTWGATAERLATKEMRLKHVDVASHTMAGTGSREQVRRYWLSYYPQPLDGEFVMGTHAPVRGRSFLKSIQMEGRCATPPRETQGPNDPAPGLPASTNCGLMPATTYSYSGRAASLARQEVIFGAPGPNLGSGPYFANPDPAGNPALTSMTRDPNRASFVDYNGDGLPDLVVGNRYKEPGEALWHEEVRAFQNSRGAAIPSLDMMCVDWSAAGGAGTGITHLGDGGFLGARPNTFGYWGTDTQVGDLWNPGTGVTNSWEWTKFVTKSSVPCRPGWTDAAGKPGLAFETVRTAPIPNMPEVNRITTFGDLDADGLTDVMYFDAATKRSFVRFSRHSIDSGVPPRIAAFAENVPAALVFRETTEVVYRYLNFADINGDGVPDAINYEDGPEVWDNDPAPKLVFADGRGTGLFQCASPGASCYLPARNLLNAAGTAHILGRTPEFIGQRMSTIYAGDGYWEKNAPIFHDVNGDGLADMLQLLYDHLDRPHEMNSSVHVAIWLNEDGQTFRRYCPSDPTGQSCTWATDQVFSESTTGTGIGPHSLRFADLDGNGTDDVLVVARDRVYRLDLNGGGSDPDMGGHGHQPAGLLVGVDNGMGARVHFRYASVQDLAERPGANWITRSPVVAWVADYVDRTTTAPFPYGHGSVGGLGDRISYSYKDPAYDPWRRRLVGFNKTRVTAAGRGTVETTYAFGQCETPAGCPFSSEDDDLLARRGRPLRVDQFDDTKPVSTTTYVYDHRRLFWGADWRASPVFFDPVILETTFLYDPDGPDSIQTVEVQTRGANNEPIIVAVTLPRATGERLQKSWTVDNFGNPTQSLDWGQVDFLTASPVDDVFRYDTTFSTFSNGWTWRAPRAELGEKNVSGSPDPDPTLRRTRVTYDTFGDTTLVEGELAGTGGVNRFHATSAAVAPAPLGESVDGWVTRAAYVRGSTGEVLQTRRGVVPSADGPSAGCQSSDYDPWVEFPVHARAYSGLCGSSTYLDGYTTYDRGFGGATAESSASGATSVMEYDEFGRVSRTYVGDRLAAGGFDPTPATITSYTVSPNGPYHIVRTQTRTGTSSYHDSYQYLDGSGDVLLTVSQADTSAGDGGPWIVSGLERRYGDGSLWRAYRPWFYSGNPLSVPITVPNGTPAAEYNIDTLGRVLEVRDTGVLVHKTQYVGLTTFQFDAEDLGTGLNKDTPSHIIRNGHGKAKFVTEQLKTASGVDFIHTVRLYNSAGQTTYQSRVHSDASGPSADGRYFVYDSLGRMQYTNDSNAAPGATAFLYSYNDQDKLVGTSDPRGCGANLFYDGYGRVKATDLSPCRDYHAPYTSPDLATGDGTESFSRYDMPDPEQLWPEYDGDLLNLRGRLVSVLDRGAYSTFGYDSRGRLKSTSRAISKPGVPASEVANRYTGHFYNKTATFDVAGRMVSVSTGADVAALLPSGSQVTYQYSGRGNVRSIGSSYGTLIASSTVDADGAPLTMTYGDVASTKATIAYDARRRGSSFTLSRTAPAFWSGTAVAPYTIPGAATTKQTTLAKYVYMYDEMSRPTTIEDQALVAEWPAGARPNRKSFTHDSLGRVLTAASDYHVGTAWTNDPQVSPYAYENGIGDTRPIPARTNTNRSRGLAIAYDWQGNTTSVTDTTNSIFDRSLSDVVNGDGAGGHPNQLTSAGAGAIEAHYDEAGNLEDLLLRRTGTCTGGKCIQRFAYEWDEDGSLARARRWDYTTLPGGEPTYPLLPARTADWEDNYAYSGMSRVRKTDRNSAGVERHTLEVFDSLRVNRATYDAGTSDYLRTNANETAYLAGLARAQYIASGVPIRAAGDTTHVFFSAGDHLGSTNVVFDQKTSELVEKVTQDAFGRTESDYRPARWAGYREDYRFTGKEEDIEVGATYFGARYYSPYLGRFMSADPLWIHARGGDSNPYAYVGGRLSHATDPFGLETFTDVTVVDRYEYTEVYDSVTHESSVVRHDLWPGEVNSRNAGDKAHAAPASSGRREKPLSQQGWGQPPSNDAKAAAIWIGVGQGLLNFIKPWWQKPVQLRGVAGRDAAETAYLKQYQQRGDDASQFGAGLLLAVFGGEIAEGIGAGAEALAESDVASAGFWREVLTDTRGALRITPAGDDVKVIGRLADTSVAKGWPGHDVLNSPNWSPNVNDEWVLDGIQKQQKFYLASPIEGNLIQTSGPHVGKPSIYATELDLLKSAGYQQRGDYMVHPNRL